MNLSYFAILTSETIYARRNKKRTESCKWKIIIVKNDFVHNFKKSCGGDFHNLVAMTN